MQKIKEVIVNNLKISKYKVYLLMNGVRLGDVWKRGIISKKRKIKIIVSLTSYSNRLNTVHKTIRTLLKQSMKPDYIILWISEDIIKESLPKNLLKLEKKGLSIKKYKDIKSYKKLIPTLKEYPNDIIITADDDMYYPMNWVKSLFNEYVYDKKCIVSNKIGRFAIENGTIDYLPAEDKYKGTISSKNKLLGACGVLYPPKSLNEEVFDEETFTEIVPTNDDLWFWSMGLLNGYKVKYSTGGLKQFLYVEGTQDGNCLWKENEKKGSQEKNEFHRQLTCLLNRYPLVREIMKRESI